VQHRKEKKTDFYLFVQEKKQWSEQNVCCNERHTLSIQSHDSSFHEQTDSNALFDLFPLLLSKDTTTSLRHKFELIVLLIR